MKKTIVVVVLIAIAAVVLGLSQSYALEDMENFSDVPNDHWAYDSVNKLRELKITDGIGDNEFGLGNTITKNEFTSFLVKLMKWDLVSPEKGSFKDNQDKDAWYYTSVETAVINGVIKKDHENFKGNTPITREEIAVMVIRTLGYDTLGEKFNQTVEKPFIDVESNKGYITMAKDFNIVTGVGDNKFNPKATAKREEAAVMMMRMYDKINKNIKDINGFYAIKSADQGDLMKDMTSVGFGWSAIDFDKSSKEVILNTSRSDSNEYSYPQGYESAVKKAQDKDSKTLLMVIGRDTKIEGLSMDNSMMKQLLNNQENRKKIINSIIVELDKKDDSGKDLFNGVVIDFEEMKGESLKESFNLFLKEIKVELNKNNKLLYTAVHPKLSKNQSYYDGYDYKTIGEISDKVILMAHDYYAKRLNKEEMDRGYTTTPITPIDEIYYGLKAITNKDTGIFDKSKILLQFSFDSAQWKLKDNKVINENPYHPTYEMINERLKKEGTDIKYIDTLESPYATFKDDTDGTDNVLWYEDSRSIQAKIDMLKLFDLEGISIWRLGNIPNFKDSNKIYLDVWDRILENR